MGHRPPEVAAASPHRPSVVELRTGSGVIAKAIASEVTRVDIHAVEVPRKQPPTHGETSLTLWSNSVSAIWRRHWPTWMAPSMW